ncbi:MAG: AI-2E family transporter [Candidatus Vogelbacteria bacterium]|nr:AI-2E family transporter [Candidatus Vogelbacteria bacterium]
MKSDSSNTTIEITTGTIVKTILILLLFWVIYYLSNLVLIILTSVVIASAIEPMTVWLMKYKLPRVPAVIIIYLVAFLLLAGMIGWFFPLVFDDFFKLINTVPQYIKVINFDNYMSSGPALLLDNFKNTLANSLSLDSLVPLVTGISQNAANGVFATAQYFFGGMSSFLLIIVISFYLSVQERGIENFLRIVTNVKYEKYIIDLWNRSQRKIGYWMQGQVLLGLLIGVFVYLGLSILGVHYALALAISASLFEIIPVFGPILAAAPGITVAFTQSPTLGLMAFGFYVIIQQFENHLIYPLVVRKIIGVPPLLVVIGIIIGLEIAGFWGAILAVPGSAVLMELVSDIEQRKRLFSEKERV